MPRRRRRRRLFILNIADDNMCLLWERAAKERGWFFKTWFCFRKLVT